VCFSGKTDILRGVVWLSLEGPGKKAKPTTFLEAVGFFAQPKLSRARNCAKPEGCLIVPRRRIGCDWPAVPMCAVRVGSGRKTSAGWDDHAVSVGVGRGSLRAHAAHVAQSGDGPTLSAPGDAVCDARSVLHDVPGEFCSLRPSGVGALKPVGSLSGTRACGDRDRSAHEVARHHLSMRPLMLRKECFGAGRMLTAIRRRRPAI
jgi:hypothetical protein